MTSKSITDATQILTEEFSKFLKIHKDFTYSQIDTNTGSWVAIKDFRLVLIQDIEQNYQHAALIVDRVGTEFTKYPRWILDYIETSKQVFVSLGDATISRKINDNSSLVFTKSVFIYADAIDVDESSIRELFTQNGLNLIMRDKNYWTQYANTKIPDAFICHDSRDKEKFVRLLAYELSKRLVKVWYDEYSLTIGDSLVDKIDEGLRQCRFGIVIVSENFLTRKKWTNREFRSLITKEVDAGKKIILPIWLGVTRDQVAQYSLDLSDKFAFSSEEEIGVIADKIVAEIRRSA